nr:murein biosynthesis integral membrane protein MurJ [Corynebacterium caspium]
MNDSDIPQKPTTGPGLRKRFIAPSLPAPVPELRKPVPLKAPADSQQRARLKTYSSPAATTGAKVAASTATAPGSAGTAASTATTAKSAGPTAPTAPQPEAGQKATDSEIVRAGGSMAIATLISRITGFIRTVLIGSSLGGAVASAFNVANTLPNLITEIVLGAVLTSLVVPVLVRAQKEDADGGAAFIRRLFTLSMTLLLTITVVAVIGAPWLTEMMLSAESKVNITQSTSFAFLLLPQIVFYGLFSLFMAVLNTQGIFKPGAWAPVANNIISIAVLIAYGVLPGSLSPTDPSGITDPHVLLLGLGMTAGVVVQLLIMVRPLRRSGIDLRPLWGIDARLKQFGGMAIAIFVYVAISQFGYIITTRIAAAAHHSGPLIYQNHWLLLQMPYGIIGVTLLTAIMPRLSRNAADADNKAVVADLTLATKLTFIALVPVVIFFTALGPQIGPALFQYWNFSAEDAQVLGLTLSFASFTLIPYALVLLHLRVFYAREEAWTPTFIIAGITVTKVVLSWLAPLVAISPAHVVILLGAANGFGFTAGAIIGIYLLRRKLGSLGLRAVLHTSLWAVASSILGIAMAMCAGFFLDLLAAPIFEYLGSTGQLVRLCFLGAIFLVVTGIVLSFSKLPEVTSLGRVLVRVPVLGRFISTAPGPKPEAPTQRDEVEAVQYIGLESFAATPVPPPMSAGIVRGPRLVPGAPVSDGRFRLIADCGSAAGARFWQAHDRHNGNLVALTFVDTSDAAPMAPLSPAAAAGRVAEITRRTRKLATLGEPGIAADIEVHAYRSGCLVVAQWVEGLPLRTVAEEAAAAGNDIDPRAASYALSSLAAAIGAAHAANIPLGLDNWARIRISTEGQAILAFPAVLPSNTRTGDLDAFATAANLLIPENAPAKVLAAKRLAEQASTLHKKDPLTGIAPIDKLDAAAKAELPSISDIAAALAAAGVAGVTEAATSATSATSATAATATAAPESAAEHLQVAPEITSAITSVPGFGARGYTRRGTWLLAIGAVAAVLAVAMAAIYVIGLLGRNSEDAPVNPESIHSGAQSGRAGVRAEDPPGVGGLEAAKRNSAQSVRDTVPVIHPIVEISLVEAPGYDSADDNPETVTNVISKESRESWTSGEYPNGLGTKPGMGLWVKVAEPMDLRFVVLNTLKSKGTHYAIYALPPGTTAAEARRMTIDELPRIADGTVTSGRTNIELSTLPPTGGQNEGAPARSDSLLIWFKTVPKETGVINVRQIQVVGQR